MNTDKTRAEDEGPSRRLETCVEMSGVDSGEVGNSQALTDSLLIGDLKSMANLQLDKSLFPKVELDEANAQQFISVCGSRLIQSDNDAIPSFLNAIMHRQFECARQLLKYAAENKIKVNLCVGNEDVLGWAIEHRSPECVDFVLKILTERHTTVEETARILNRHFISLLSRFPRILMRFLQKDRFCFEFGRFEVPLSLFDAGEECPVAMVSDQVPPWEAESSDAAKQFWKDSDPELAEKLENSSGVMVMAVSKFVCVENALCHGMGNILFPLVVADAPAEIFKSGGLKTLVQWKWRTYCRRRFCMCGFLHLLAAVFFSIFASLFGLYCEGSSGCLVTARVAVSLSCLLVWFLNFTGMRPRLRVISCITMTVLFFYAQFAESQHVYTAALTALECISFWVSVLYYLQPFRSTGPLISMMRYVLLDMAPLVLLGVLIVVGFGFAFLVLFEDDFATNVAEFRTPQRSFETLFHAMLGEFDTEVFHGGDNSHSELSLFRSILFNVYLFFGGVILLTFLIAVLSDTYDKVKVSEQAELIKCRARIVGIWDGWNNMVEKLGRFTFRLLRLMNVDQLMIKTQERFFNYFRLNQKPKKKFFHFLVPAEPVAKGMDLTWEGKIRAFVKSVKGLLRENDERMSKESAELKNEVASLREEIAALRDDVRSCLSADSESRLQSFHMRRRSSDRIEQGYARLTSRFDSLDSVNSHSHQGQGHDGQASRSVSM